MSDKPGTASDTTSDDKLWSLLAYVLSPLAPIIIMLMEDKKNRPFIRAHNVQALLWGLIVSIVGSVTIPLVVGFCILPLGFIVEVYWGYKAYQGQYVNIPVVTNFVKSQGWA